MKEALERIMEELRYSEENAKKEKQEEPDTEKWDYYTETD